MLLVVSYVGVVFDVVLCLLVIPAVMPGAVVLGRGPLLVVRCSMPGVQGVVRVPVLYLVCPRWSSCCRARRHPARPPVDEFTGRLTAATSSLYAYACSSLSRGGVMAE